MKSEDKIRNVLLEEYNLPEYSPEDAGEKWKEIAKKEWTIREWEWITTYIRLRNWKELKLELWGRYDNEWNLDYKINTIYPYKE